MNSRKMIGLLVCALVAACGGSDDDSPDTVVPDASDDGQIDAPDEDSGDQDGTGVDAPDTTVDTGDTALPDTALPDSTLPDADDVLVPGDTTDAADGDADDDTEVTDPPERTARLTGRVVLAGTAGSEGIAGARITVDGVTAVTDAAGYYELEALPARTPVGVDVRGPAGELVYSSFHRRMTLSAASDQTLDAVLLPGCTVTFDIGDQDGVLLPGPCVGSDRTIGLTLPQNGVVDAEGTPVTRVRAEMVVLPVHQGGERSPDALVAFPGDMAGVDAGGTSVYIESFGAVEVRLLDPDTRAPLQLAPDATAEVLFQAASATLDGDPSLPIPAWSYDPETAAWVEEGTTTLFVEPFSGALMHRLTVRHFTWWNADRVVDRTCLSGRVIAGDGEGFPGVAIAATGIDYLGSSGSTTRADGTFEVFARQASDVTVTASRTIERRTVQATRTVRTGATATPCLELPDILLDDAPLFACARGRVVTQEGAPVPRASVTNVSGRVTTQAVTNTDGTYCLPLPPEATVDLVIQASIASVPYRGTLAAVTGVPGSGTCTDAPTTCTTLADAVVQPLGCVTGTVTSEFGGTGGAFVRIDGGIGQYLARTDGSGGWCATVETNQVLTVEAIGSVAGITRTGLQRSIDGPTGGGQCGEPVSCRNVDVVLDASSCIRGRVLTDAGVTSGTRVTVTERAGNWRRQYSIPPDGNFCLPAPGNRQMDLEFDAFGPGTRFTARAATLTPTTAATCGSGTCAEVGDVTLAGQSFTGCVRGRLRYDGLPYRERINVDIGGVSTFVRPDRAGAFCVPATSDVRLVLRDSQDRSGCVRAPEIPRDIAALSAGGCDDPTSCLDLEELDFADFCARS